MTKARSAKLSKRVFSVFVQFQNTLSSVVLIVFNIYFLFFSPFFAQVKENYYLCSNNIYNHDTET